MGKTIKEKEVLSLYNYYKNRPSLGLALASAFGRDYIFAGFLKLIHDIMQFVGPIALNLLIDFMNDEKKDKVSIYFFLFII